MSKEITARECKFVQHLPKSKHNDNDVHFIKEVIHYNDGSKESRFKTIKDFQRPYYVTMEHYRNHKHKKESESKDRLARYTSTESDLGSSIASKLGYKYQHKKHLRDVIDSPYVYGTDISSKALIKQSYIKKYPNANSISTLAVLDIEVDTITNELIILSIARQSDVYVYILDRLVENYKDYDRQLNFLYNKYIPKTEYLQNTQPHFIVCKSEIDMVKEALKMLHTWKPDFVAVWNIDYDIPFIIDVCKKYYTDPKDIFSDPDIPKEYRFFKYVEGARHKVTESGVHKPINPEEQWHVVQVPSSFYWICAMRTHRFIRVGGKAVPGGYSLNNILTKELGKEYKKLKFEDLDTPDIEGLDWHKYMVENRPLEYIIYNVWDVLSMLELDNKTKDICSSISVLSGCSSYDIFNSGPKKIVEALHFFYLDRNRVLACKPREYDGNKLLGLDDWIVMLSKDMLSDKGEKFIEEDPNLRTNIYTHVADSDAVSSYPSNTQAANVSRDTLSKEIIDIANIPKEVFKLQNINLMFGKVNAIEYCSKMLSFPTLEEIDTYIK